MADGEGNAENLEIRYNVDRILDCHTHLTGMKGESAESILECMDFCGVKKIFLFAPMLDIQNREVTSDNLDDIRTMITAPTSAAKLLTGCWVSAR